jgi:FkbM family methyltransferase
MSNAKTAVRKLVSRLAPERFLRIARTYHLRSMFKDRAACEGDLTLNVLPKLVRSGDFALDIGANMGVFTRRLAELVGPSGSVWAFELVPDTYEILTYNMRGYANVTCRDVAISAKTGTVGYHVPKHSDGLPDYYCAYLTDNGSIPATSIDELVATTESLARVDFMKIDVEGAEAEVIDGAKETLRKFRPSLVVESKPESPIFGTLDRTGYDVFAIHDGKLMPYTGQKEVNYAFIHRQGPIDGRSLIATQ